jgi:hypothetical protein
VYFKEKHLYLIHSIYHDPDGHLAETMEPIGLHAGLLERQAGVCPKRIEVRIALVIDHHRQLPRPKQLGQTNRIRRKTEDRLETIVLRSCRVLWWETDELSEQISNHGKSEPPS